LSDSDFGGNAQVLNPALVQEPITTWSIASLAVVMVARFPGDGGTTPSPDH
jgi:hypothetical protein